MACSVLRTSEAKAEKGKKIELFRVSKKTLV